MILGGAYAVSFLLLQRLRLSLNWRLALSLLIAWVIIDLVAITLDSIRQNPWILLSVPLTAGGYLVYRHRQASKVEPNIFRPF